MFKIGDKVTWESQAGGYTTRKTGTVVYIAWSRLEDGPLVIASKVFPNHKVMFSGLSWRGPLVEVITGPKARPRLYMPIERNLRKVSDE